MASFLKYTEAFLKQFSDCKWKRRSSKENLVVVLMLVVQRRRLLIISGYVHLVFAFQMRSRLKYKQT